MIRYALLCGRNHGFEAWFRDSEAFDLQSAGGHVSCPVCGGAEIRKAVMAPAVRRSTQKRNAPVTEPAEAPVPEAPAPTVPSIVDAPFARMREAVREIHAKLKRDAVDVGPSFPEQARAIHDGDAPPRAIYGTATDDEVRGMIEDGVGILPLPTLPDDRN